MHPLLALADHRFVSLTTFRRSGAPPAVREERTDVARAGATVRRTYPIESRLVLGIERLVERLRGRPRTLRLALHITAA